MAARLDQSEIGGPAALAEWEALYILEATEADPEVTEWDDDALKKRKLARANEAKAK